MGKIPGAALLCCMLLACALLAGCGESEEEALYKQRVFRNIHWGMTPEEVRERETAQFDSDGVATNRGTDEYYLRYLDVEFLGRNWVLRYFFFENQCFEAAYYVKNTTLKEYERIRNEFVQLHGEPKRLYNYKQEIVESWGGSNIIPYRYLHLKQGDEQIDITVRFVFMPFAPL